MAPIQLMSGVPMRRQRLSTPVTSPPHIQRTVSIEWVQSSIMWSRVW